MGIHEKKRNGRGLLGWLSGLGAVLISVAKYIPSLLKLGKAGGTLISMLVAVWAYALIFPWSFSIGIVVMIFIHEMGHILAARQKGLPVSAPAFIPFLGALITLKKQPQDAETEAYVAYGGPLIGSLGAFACYGLAHWTDYKVLYAIALIGFLINLFNLLPIHPLDGGRIVTAISRWFWVLGLVGGLALIVYSMNPILILIWVLFAFQLWETFLSRRKEKPRSLNVRAEVERALFENNGVMPPSEKHQRELPTFQYCTLSDHEHWCDIHYPGVGAIHRMNGFTGRFGQVWLLGTEREKQDKVRMKLQAYYYPGAEETSLRRDEEYYQVSPKVRFAYGVAYLGLAVFLLYMLYLLGSVSLTGPQVVS
ncbi:site-2 protease family protein [Salinithrix halophila]|uniref:Site-2 protease family protein n=1 Tax=Salinithrix halophila TaxID=1485204 RepID=A0ABV8J997_9BACL